MPGRLGLRGLTFFELRGVWFGLNLRARESMSGEVGRAYDIVVRFLREKGIEISSISTR
jgi:hypothetical protein